MGRGLISSAGKFKLGHAAVTDLRVDSSRVSTCNGDFANWGVGTLSSSESAEIATFRRFIRGPRLTPDPMIDQVSVQLNWMIGRPRISHDHRKRQHAGHKEFLEQVLVTDYL